MSLTDALNIEQMDRDIHAELQHVNVVLSQVRSLRNRHPLPMDEHQRNPIRDRYNAVIDALNNLRTALRQADVQHYEVDAG